MGSGCGGVDYIMGTGCGGVDWWGMCGEVMRGGLREVDHTRWVT